MKRWKDCRGTPERMRALLEAFTASRGEAKRAAALLGIDRSYLYDILRTHGDPRVGTTHTDNTVGSSNTESDTDTSTGVARTPENPLTYPRSTPSFRVVTSATASIEKGEQTQTELLTVEIPKRCKDWLELEALLRKQRGENPRGAMKTVVTGLIEEAMARATKRDAKED